MPKGSQNLGSKDYKIVALLETLNGEFLFLHIFCLTRYFMSGLKLPLAIFH